MTEVSQAEYAALEESYRRLADRYRDALKAHEQFRATYHAMSEQIAALERASERDSRIPDLSALLGANL